MNKAYTGAYLPGCRVNDIYSLGSDKLAEVQLYMSTSCHPGSWVIRAFSDVGKPFLFSDLAAKAARSENKKRLFNVRNARISSRVNKFY